MPQLFVLQLRWICVDIDEIASDGRPLGCTKSLRTLEMHRVVTDFVGAERAFNFANEIAIASQ